MCANVVNFDGDLSYILSDKKEKPLNRGYNRRVTLQQDLKKMSSFLGTKIRLQVYVGIFLVPLEFISDANDVVKAFISLSKN